MFSWSTINEFIASWSQGLLDLSALQLVIITLILTHITIVSVTVYLHRYSAHRSLELNAGLKHFFRFWLWLTTGMRTKSWTAIHRKHHAHCETKQDPHSPVMLGLKEVFWRGAELYQQADTDAIRDKFGKGTPDDWLERNLYDRYSVLGVTLMAIIDLLLFGIIGLTVWAMQMIWIPLFAAGVINGVGHARGYRNFECPDAARNIVPWGILIGGEELHNNHHTYPNSPKLSCKWWEIDIGWAWISLFKALGLARVKRPGPLYTKVPGKQVIDVNTAWAALNNRFQIMADYSRKVVAPVVKLEQVKLARLKLKQPEQPGKNLLKRARKLLCRAGALKDEKTTWEIQQLITHHPSLQRIYEMRQSLDEIWRKGSAGSAELTEALREWCKKAEESGIDVLNEFANYLRSYTLPAMPAST